jgi:hypothetical protein
MIGGGDTIKYAAVSTRIIVQNPVTGTINLRYVSDDIEYHEARFKVNNHFENYYAAQHHLTMVISNRIKKIMHRHC